MNQDRTKRKLTAILSADVVGYSRLMEADETWTIKSLDENKRQISDLVEEYKGRVVDAPGDNILAEFSSVINAVECAVDIQKDLEEKNARLIEKHRMHFRIGVNLGDVVREDERIYGNGVNITARLEGLADPGGICISGTAYDQVISKLNLEYEYLGEQGVKNIAIPIRVYRVLIDTEAAGKVINEKRSQKIVNPSNIAVVIIILLVFALGTTIAIFVSRPYEPRRVMRFSHELPEGQHFTPDYQLAVSPDGTQFVYLAGDGLYLRSVDKLEARHIAGTDQKSVLPTFSPDGQWIGYWSSNDRKLKKIAISGGAPVVLCDTTAIVGGLSWCSDNTILYSDVTGGGIMRVSADGGTPETLIKAALKNIQKNGVPSAPQMLPDGKTLLFTNIFSPTNIAERQITIQSLESGERKILVGGINARYLSTGYLVYEQVNNNIKSIVAVPFDPDTPEMKGKPVTLIEGVMGYAFSDSGTLVYISGPPGVAGSPGETGSVVSEAPERKMVWVDFEGKETFINMPPRIYRYPKISPDGTRVALMAVYKENPDIWIWDLERETLTRLTFNEGTDITPVWSPDSKRIAFHSERESTILKGVVGGGVFCKSADGTGEDQLLCLGAQGRVMPICWSGDGKTLLMSRFINDGTENQDIVMLSMNDDNVLKPLLMESYMEIQPRLSPDGRWMVYSSNESGQMEVYVRPFPEVNTGRWQVSTSGGNSPLWSPDGRKIFYLIGNTEGVMAVEVETEPVFKPGKPGLLFKGSYVGAAPADGVPWDNHPDGKRFLMMKEPETTAGESSNGESVATGPRKITIVLNWDEELKQRVTME